MTSKHRFFEGPIVSYLAVEDKLAGKRHRYTVYAFKMVGDRRSEIVGREVTIKDAEKMARIGGAR